MENVAKKKDPLTLALKISRGVVMLIYVVVLAYTAILSIAFVLKLIGADPSGDFADWIYRSADRIMQPFRGIFPTEQPDDASVFDASLLFAIVVYSVAGALLGLAVDHLTNRVEHRLGAPQPAPAFPPPPPPTTVDLTTTPPPPPPPRERATSSQTAWGDASPTGANTPVQRPKG